MDVCIISGTKQNFKIMTVIQQVSHSLMAGNCDATDDGSNGNMMEVVCTAALILHVHSYNMLY